MHFLVVGRDGPDFVLGPSDLHEAHWAYMDGWSAELIARGPTLSSDGTVHTGSVHVVDVADVGVARRFANEEPYARAGWYSAVTVTPVQPCVGGTMWDRPLPTTDQAAAYVHAGLPPHPDAARVVGAVRRRLAGSGDPEWLYLGVTVNEDNGRPTGLVGMTDLTPAEGRAGIEALVEAATGSPALEVECHRWRRGGRPER